MAESLASHSNTRRLVTDLNAWTRQRQEAALEPTLPILDPHHHLWDDNRRGHYLLPELLEDLGTGHNIVATVFVETGMKYRADGPPEKRSIGEVEFVHGLAEASISGGDRMSRLCAGIVGYADLMLGDRVEPVLEALIEAGNGRLRGIRYSVTWDANQPPHPRRPMSPQRLRDPAFRRGFACLQPLGLSFDARPFYTQLPDMVDLLRAFPESNVILNHAGGLLSVTDGDKRDDVYTAWRNHIRELAQFPNLSVKVGGLGMPACGWDFHLRDVPPSSDELATAWRPFVEACIETFGVNRCMLESNFPTDKQSCGYGVLWNALKRITQGYSQVEKAALYHDTAARVYRLMF